MISEVMHTLAPIQAQPPNFSQLLLIRCHLTYILAQAIPSVEMPLMVRPSLNFSFPEKLKHSCNVTLKFVRFFLRSATIFTVPVSVTNSFLLRCCELLEGRVYF